MLDNMETPVLARPIHAKAHYSFLDERIRIQLIDKNTPFYDANFNYNYSKALCCNKLNTEEDRIVWKRISTNNIDVDWSDPNFNFPQYKLSEVQSKMHVYAFLLLSQHDDAGYIRRLFELSQLKENLLLKVHICLGGIWTSVIIDDHLPFIKNKKNMLELASTGINKGIWWPSFLEKAFSKVIGGYERLERLEIENCLRDITGAPISKFELFSLSLDDLYKIIVEEFRLGHLIYFINKTIPGSSQFEKPIIPLSVPYKLVSIDSQNLSVGLLAPFSDLLEETLSLNILADNFDYVAVLGLSPTYTYSSEHVQFSSNHKDSSLIKLCIQEAGEYTISVSQKDPIFFDCGSFQSNTISAMLGKVADSGIEFVGLVNGRGEREINIKIDETEREHETTYVLLIDIEANKYNYLYENEYPREERTYNEAYQDGSVCPWRDIVVSVYGPFFTKIISFAYDSNRQILYDFFFHRILRNYARFHRSDESVMMLSKTMDGLEIELLVEIFILQGLTLHKVNNLSCKSIKLSGWLGSITKTPLPINIECYSASQVNGKDPYCIINPQSDETIAYKFGDRIEAVGRITFHEETLLLEEVDPNNYDIDKEEPLKYFMNCYLVQLGITYPVIFHEQNRSDIEDPICFNNQQEVKEEEDSYIECMQSEHLLVDESFDQQQDQDEEERELIMVERLKQLQEVNPGFMKAQQEFYTPDNDIQDEGGIQHSDLPRLNMQFESQVFESKTQEPDHRVKEEGEESLLIETELNENSNPEFVNSNFFETPQESQNQIFVQLNSPSFGRADLIFRTL